MIRSDDRWAQPHPEHALLGVGQRGGDAWTYVFVRPEHAEDMAVLWVQGDYPTVEAMCSDVREHMRATGWLAERERGAL